MTKQLLKCARRKDSLHFASRKAPDNLSLLMKYKNYRNVYHSILQSQKKLYESELIASNKHNSKKLWDTVKDICSIKTTKTDTPDLLKVEQTEADSLNLVNNFFSSVGNSLAHKILTKLDSNEQELASKIDNQNSPTASFFFMPTDAFEIKKIISCLKSASAPGSDKINNQVLKTNCLILAPLIAHICNLSMIQGIVPDCLKTADICPIHKSGSTLEVSNYRPISLLPSLSKVLEKVVNNRLLNFLEKHDILSKNQFGFRRNKSTEDAVVSLVDDVTTRLDSSQKALGVFLDLAKAFDTVSWPILLRKLEILGIRGCALDWFRSYLSNRQQRVKISNQYSDYCEVSFGVPQGSVLGPTLFLMYINDLCQLKMHQTNIYTFADDTALIFYGDSWKEVVDIAHQGLTKVAMWLQTNLLTLNAEKTKYLTFQLTQRTEPISIKLKIHSCGSYNDEACDCAVLERVNHIKYLGVKIDHTLTFESHIKSLRGRLRKMLHVFKRLGSVADSKTVKTVYLALCQSLLSYCIVSWGSAVKTRLLKLETAQRAVLKVAYKKPFRYPTTDLYKDTDCLTVRQLYILAVTQRFHKSALDTATSTRKTSRRNAWMFPMTRTCLAKRAFYCRGPTLYQKFDKSLELLETSRFVLKKRMVSSLDYYDTEKILKNIDT